MRLPTRLLVHTVDVQVPVGIYDELGPKQPLRCRVSYERKLIVKSDGSEAVAEGTIYARPGMDVPLRSQVTLPDGTARRVVAVAVQTGRRSPEVLELNLQ